MPDNAVEAFGRGFAGFAHSRAGDLVGTSFKDSGSLVKSLFDGTEGTTKAAFKTLKADIDALVPLVQALVTALEADISNAKAAVAEMAAEIAKTPFQADELARVLTALGKLLVAYDSAIGKCAEKLAEQTPAGPGREAVVKQIKDEINGMNAPIKKLFANIGNGVIGGFNDLVSLVLGIDNAATKLEDKLTWDYGEKQLTLKLVQVGPAAVPPLNFDGGKLEAYFKYKTEFSAGIKIKTNLKAGLRSDKLLEKIIPKQAVTADSEGVAITIDTAKGITFGDGPNKRLVLPVRVAWPGIELREFAIEQPAINNVDVNNRVNVVFTVAGKLGDVFAVVVEGGGISIRWVDGGAPSVTPKIPSGAGLRIATPIVTGGGYLRYDEAKSEYGGVFQLEIAKIGVTAIGLIGTNPFNLVIVIGVRFAPKIELGYGFTLNGLGGILAIERTLDSLALADGLKNDVVGQLLFPADPVAAAPQILNQLGAIFPPKAGGFVIGPIAELGWGSQAGFLKARLGVVLSLPDPKITLLGAIQIGVPSAELPPNLRLVDLNANIMGEVSADYFFIKVSLAKSKVFKLELTGDIALYVQWAGEGAFAMSVGGFFPGYEYPKQLGTMDRVGIKFAPPVPWLSISAVCYFAVTANSVQFGGKVSMQAEVGPATADAWLQLDALFQWSPYFYFEIRLDVGIKVKAFGITLAGVQFTGKISGDQPWHLEGLAVCEIAWWDVKVPIGPMEWGEPRPANAAPIDSVQQAGQALNSAEAWTPQLPPGAQHIVRLSPNADTPLYHPLGELLIRQLQVPLETEIDRIGSRPVMARRINLQNPRLGGVPPAAVWHVTDRFSPGHFLQLTDAQVLARGEFEVLPSGIGLAAARGAKISAATHAAYRWNTVFPGSGAASGLQSWKINKNAAKYIGQNAASALRAAASNPYIVAKPLLKPEILRDRGVVQVARADTLQPISGVYVTPSAAQWATQTTAGLTTLAPGMM